MKKFLLLMTLSAGLMSAQADNTVVVSPVTVPQGGTGSFDIELNNDVVFTAFTMELTLPEGITYDSKAEGSRFDGHSVDDGAKDGKKTFAALSGSSKPELLSGASVSGGTQFFEGMACLSPTVSGGSAVSLSTYSGSRR